MSRLPVSGAEFSLAGADGACEMQLLEGATSDIGTALQILARTVRFPADDTMGLLRALTITDFEYLVLQLRASWCGSQIVLGLACPTCRSLAQVSLETPELLKWARSRPPEKVCPHEGLPGWFTLEDAVFRLPTVGDLIDTEAESRRFAALLALTIQEGPMSQRLRARVERAMSLMAPELSRSIRGSCPGCRQPLTTHLSVVPLTVKELRQSAAQLHDEIDLIARHYHWPQSEILALPIARRRSYVERIRRALTQAA